MKKQGKWAIRVWLIAIVLVMAMVAGQAKAAVLSDVFNFNLPTYGSLLGFTLDKFDTRLGTLTGIELYSDTWVTPGLYVTNTGVSPISFTKGNSYLTLALTTPSAAYDVEHTAFFTNKTGTVPAETVDMYFTKTPTNQHMEQTTAIDLADFGLFSGMGGGIADFVVDLTTASIGLTASGLTFSPAGSATGTVEIKYTYDPTPPATVPLPSALFLLGPGLIGLATIRRRYKDRN